MEIKELKIIIDWKKLIFHPQLKLYHQKLSWKDIFQMKIQKPKLMKLLK